MVENAIQNLGGELTRMPAQNKPRVIREKGNTSVWPDLFQYGIA
jgi:hypothetical protein